MDNFFPYKKIVTINASTNLYFELVPKMGNLSIRFNVIPQKLFIDGKRTTEYRNIPITFGEHTIFAYHTKYKFLRWNLNISKESHVKITLNFLKHYPPSGLEIYSKPSKADVYFDNLLLGQTPFYAHNITPDILSFTVVKEGYQDFPVIASIGKKHMKRINAVLKKIPEE
jgi:hypothetical protein